MYYLGFPASFGFALLSLSSCKVTTELLLYSNMILASWYPPQPKVAKISPIAAQTKVEFYAMKSDTKV